LLDRLFEEDDVVLDFTSILSSGLEGISTQAIEAKVDISVLDLVLVLGSPELKGSISTAASPSFNVRVR
jgi:hypothetical protein